ncbi:MAG: tyrosine-type recombinase/integrase [Planctomycetota bacterium]|nr:tyrosine-type recombinase/integrase [Planctomycetota bacterium]
MNENDQQSGLPTAATPTLTPVALTAPAPMPRLVAAAGAGARFGWEEFLYGRLRNPHTRRSYHRAASRFLRWCEERGLALHTIAPAHVGHFLDGLPDAVSSKKVYLAAIRHLFDTLVLRHAVALNSAASVRAERYLVVEGKTPEIPIEQARRLLSTVDTSHVVGLRDRAIIAMLIYTAARIGAVARLRLQDLFETGDQYCLRFLDKGGKSREIPVRHDLQGFLFEYLTTADLCDAPSESPLFRSAIRRTKELTDLGMTADDIGRMVKRRMRDAGLPRRLSAHSFRVTTVTDLLAQGVPLEDVQHLAGHSDPRTTRLYDRRQRRVTRNIVERISI